MKRGKKIAHWIADAVAVGGVSVLGLVAKGAIALTGWPLALVAVGTGLALKVSRSPVASSTAAVTEGGSGDR